MSSYAVTCNHHNLAYNQLLVTNMLDLNGLQTLSSALQYMNQYAMRSASVKNDK